MQHIYIPSERGITTKLWLTAAAHSRMNGQAGCAAMSLTFAGACRKNALITYPPYRAPWRAIRRVIDAISREYAELLNDPMDAVYGFHGHNPGRRVLAAWRVRIKRAIRRAGMDEPTWRKLMMASGQKWAAMLELRGEVYGADVPPDIARIMFLQEIEDFDPATYPRKGAL